jgi:hypothetical protein
MKVRVLKGFEDFDAGVIRQAGEVFEATKVRFKALQSALPMDFVEEAEEGTEE